MRRHCVAAWWMVAMAATISGVHAVTTTPSAETCPVELAEGTSRLEPVIEKHEAALFLLLGFGGFSVLVALCYKALRKYVFGDSHSLDTVFDAGGRVSVSLTAVTVTSQLLWPADFLQSSTLISKSGIGGSLWFTLAIVIDILLFPTLSLKLKTRAPGAKTFPQIAYARFGKPAHILFCILAIATNLTITASLLLAGKAAIEVLTENTSSEFIMLVLAVLFGSYCLIGGLGTTFYISYFNTALTFISVSIFILETTYFASPETKAVASREAMYEAMSCIKGPDGNFENSLLTFRTRSGVIYGIVLLFMATSVSFCDQANWQSRIAAKPAQGVVGFLIAAYLWFALPTSISFTAAMSYMSMSYQNGTNLLAAEDIDNGYITPFVMQAVLGSTGGYLLLTMLMMALMSTGSGEVMSISSIIVYDIYKTYVCPFRNDLKPSDCVLCGKDKCSGECSCPTSQNCHDCAEDKHLVGGRNWGAVYKCPTHGKYRHYEDELMRYKSWCMVWIVILIVPYGLLVVESGMNLNWAVMAGQVFTCPFFVPIFMTLVWSKATAKGVVSGSLVGLICCVIGMLVAGSMYENGLSEFFVNTAKEYSLLAGLAAGTVSSTIVAVTVSLCTHQIKTKQDEAAVWAKTMNIDNPLSPYRAVYEEELKEIDAGPVITTDTMAMIFRRAQQVAYIGGGISVVLFMVIIPAIAASYEIVTLAEFDRWLSVCQVWCLIGTVFVVLFPPIEEGIQIMRQYKQMKSRRNGATPLQPTNLQVYNSNFPSEFGNSNITEKL